ncbi:thioredoxin domain-containing protein, partial [Candidatus Gottesmanbacteria bacterium]|nr:thioredoxin domain-containing protein [Candidatus Gottesmanbacteria bacterium]
DKDAKAVLVEYSDFQCPACAFYYSMVNSLEREIGKKMLFVYRHYPLTQHKNARLAAAAAEAAGLQGKFWEMHALLFENQKIWSDTDDARKIFTDYAKSLTLDMMKFEKDLDLQEVKDKVENDLKSGQALGVDATPTFYLNGKKLSNIESYEQFKQIIEKEAEKT